MALYNAWRVASTPKCPLDSFNIINCFHISHAIVAPLMCIISTSPITNLIWVWAFASPVFHTFCNLISASVGGVFATGGAQFSSMYSSIPKSLRIACIWHFHGICHIPFLPFLCSLIWSLVLLFWLAIEFMMPWHFIMFSLFHYLQPPSLCPPSSVPCPPSILHHPRPHPPSSVTLITSFHLHVSQLLASPFHSIIIFPTSTHYSLPLYSNFVYLTFHPLWLCESFSTFSVLPRSPSLLWLQNIFSYKPVLVFGTEQMAIFNSHESKF